MMGYTTTPTIKCAALALVLMLLQTACGFLNTKKTAIVTEFTSNNTIQQWLLKGKIGIRSQQQAHSTYLNWQQCGNHYDIRLSGPLGQTKAHLYGVSQRMLSQKLESHKPVAHLSQQHTQPITASNPDQLLFQQLGWNIPVTQLFYWIRGIPTPDHTYHPYDDGFQQSGWQLSYPKSTTTNLYTLPAKVIAKHPQLQVTFILKTWDLNPDCQIVEDAVVDDTIIDHGIADHTIVDHTTANGTTEETVPP
jgi:outer membrane lipoprotein LolB